MTLICDKEHIDLANALRRTLALYNQNYDLITIGAYRKGTNPALDDAIARIDRVNGFLTQGVTESYSFPKPLRFCVRFCRDRIKGYEKI